METFNRSGETVVAINGLWLYGAVQLGAAYWLWPSKPEWWGFGLMSILVAAGGLVSVVQALKLMQKDWHRRRAISEMQSRGGKPKDSKLASRKMLKEQGMIDD